MTLVVVGKMSLVVVGKMSINTDIERGVYSGAAPKQPRGEVEGVGGRYGPITADGGGGGGDDDGRDASSLYQDGVIHVAIKQPLPTTNDRSERPAAYVFIDMSNKGSKINKTIGVIDNNNNNTTTTTITTTTTTTTTTTKESLCGLSSGVDSCYAYRLCRCPPSEEDYAGVRVRYPEHPHTRLGGEDNNGACFCCWICCLFNYICVWLIYYLRSFFICLWNNICSHLYLVLIRPAYTLLCQGICDVLCIVYRQIYVWILVPIYTYIVHPIYLVLKCIYDWTIKPIIQCICACFGHVYI